VGGFGEDLDRGSAGIPAPTCFIGAAVDSQHSSLEP
jgi:hypothetical protein